jgi:putative hydrolase of the HAD superfamily
VPLKKAVFFDWFNTLACYSPSREELQSQALREFGYNVSPEQLLPAILAADRDLFDEYAVYPVNKRSPEEQARIYYRYQQTVLGKVGVDVSGAPDLIPKVMKKARDLYADIRFVLYDDALPALKSLKEKGLILGIISNVDSDMRPVCRELGLDPYLDFIVTSAEAGADKPQPEIFVEALNRARVEASEAVHVGDQVNIDAVGAKNAGIKALVLDRYGQYPDMTEFTVIHRLSETADHLG